MIWSQQVPGILPMIRRKSHIRLWNSFFLFNVGAKAFTNACYGARYKQKKQISKNEERSLCKFC